MTEGSRRAILAALFANLGIAIAKFAGWFATGAASMLAEAVHSVADTSNQALLILGGSRAKKEPSPEHPFGYGRERYFWAFIVATVLFLLGGLFATYEGVSKFTDPHELSSPQWAMGILLLGIVLEGFSLRTAIVASNAVRGKSDWWSFVRHSKSPELPVVLLEDMGAMLGLVLALLGVSLAHWTGDPRFDAAGSVAIGILLMVISVVLAIEMKSLLIGEAARPRQVESIRALIEGSPGIERVIHMRTLHLGPDEILVAAKLEFAAHLDFTGVAQAIDSAEDTLRREHPSVGPIYLEPDLHRGSAAS